MFDDVDVDVVVMYDDTTYIHYLLFIYTTYTYTTDDTIDTIDTDYFIYFTYFNSIIDDSTLLPLLYLY